MRDPLKTGTWVCLPDSGCYEITGAPIGEGGLSLVYPAIRQVLDSHGHYHAGRAKFVLKECYPIPHSFGDPPFVRAPSGQIMPGAPFEKLAADLKAAQTMQLKERQITEEIYATSSRLAPVIDGSSQVRLSFDKGQTFVTVQNTVTVMDSLADKGQALRAYLSGPKRITLLQAFRVTEQILFAVQEVHRAGYIHLDLQDTNIFIHDSLTESSSLATLIDMGSARRLLADGRCPAVPEGEAFFAMEDYAAPEIRRQRDRPPGPGRKPLRQSSRFLGLGTRLFRQSSRSLGIGTEDPRQTSRPLGMGAEDPRQTSRPLGMGAEDPRQAPNSPEPGTIPPQAPGSLRLGPEADIYSIGSLLLQLLTGKRPKAEAIFAHKGGHHLTHAQVKPLNCPKHLIERMQQILAKALENDPKDRYQSCDQMLGDLSDFIAALKPYRSDLSQVAYDAFICYKHGPIDSRAAAALQKGLEHFPVPKDLRKENRKIRRVFMDEGELSSCADMGLQITEALKNAGYLIVICSPETKASPWVDKEIKTFLTFHDRSRILPVMTGGEPLDIFPDVLLRDPQKERLVRRRPGGYRSIQGRKGLLVDGIALAADARGEDLPTVLKKIKKDVVLRVAAPILGTTYDSLKQRHKAYRMQKIAALALTALLVLSAFTAQTLRQSAQIREQYQQARINQARYLSRLSQELFTKGDREKALLTALAVEPEKDADGPVVPEQLYALNNALTSYKDGYGIRYDPAFIGEAEGIRSGTLSTDGTCYLAIDRDQNAVVLSCETGRVLSTITPAMVKASVDDPTLYHQEDLCAIHMILPLSGHRAALILDHCIAVVDLEDQAIWHTSLLDVQTPPNGQIYDQRDQLFAYGTTDGQLYVIDLETGRQIAYANLREVLSDAGHIYTVESLSIHEDQNTIALGLSYRAAVNASDSGPGQGAGTDTAPSNTRPSSTVASDTTLSGPGPSGVAPSGSGLSDAVSSDLPLFATGLSGHAGTPAQPAGLLLYRCDDQQFQILSADQTENVLWADASHVAAIHFTDPVSGNTQIDIGGALDKSYRQALYVVPSGRLLYEGETTTIRPSQNTGLAAAPFQIDGDTFQTTVAWVRGKLTVLDNASGSALVETTYRPDIIGAAAYGEGCLLVSLNNGTVQYINALDRIRSREVLSLATDTSGFSYDPDSDRLILLSDDRTLFCDSAGDPGMKELALETLLLDDMADIAPQEVSIDKRASDDGASPQEADSNSSAGDGTSSQRASSIGSAGDGTSSQRADSISSAGDGTSSQRASNIGSAGGDMARSGSIINTDVSGYVEVAGKSFRYLGLRQSGQSITDISTLLVSAVPEGPDRWIYRYVSPGPDYSIGNIGFGYDPKKDLWSIAFTERSPEGRSLFRKADLFTGEELICEDITDYDPYNTYDSHRIVYSPHMETMFLKKSLGILRLDLSGNVLRTDGQWLLDGQEILTMALSGDGSHLAFMAEDLASGKRALYSYGMETGTLTELAVDESTLSDDTIAPVPLSDPIAEGPAPLPDPVAEGPAPISVPALDKSKAFLVCGRSSPLLCLYDGAETLYILDQKKGAIRQTIHTGFQEDLQAAFFDQDQYLLTASRDTVRLYDLATGQILHSYTFPDADRQVSRKIITDSSSRYFGVKTNSSYESYAYDPGTNRRPLSIFYVDDRHAFYPYADVDSGYASFSGGEVSAMDSSRLSYSGLYGYPQLKEKALRILDERTLSEEEAIAYFIQQANP